MKFTIIHPSRGRPFLAYENFVQWMSKASGVHEYEYIVSIDTTECHMELYKKKFDGSGCKLIINDNRSVVDAVNIAAVMATGDCIVSSSDDFDCPDKWDEELRNVFGAKKDYAILINDGIQQKIMTLPILSRSVYEKIGYIYFGGYFSMFCDNDLTELCSRLGVLINAPLLVFKHNHYTVLKQRPDETYKRENSKHAYDLGRKVYEQRRDNNFGLNA